ncbi:hypothetical protein AVEN_168740-1, partial [Araneus ventricosus]
IRGLCICGIFSASLSTVSLAINSLASVATDDFIKPLFPKLILTSFHTKIMKSRVIASSLNKSFNPLDARKEKLRLVLADVLKRTWLLRGGALFLVKPNCTKAGVSPT